MLKDNKSYPYIEITNDKYPRLIISRPRKLKNHKGRLFGPYPNSNAARKTVELLNRIYPFRKCHTMEKKVCLYYSLPVCRLKIPVDRHALAGQILHKNHNRSDCRWVCIARQRHSHLRWIVPIDG